MKTIIVCAVSVAIFGNIINLFTAFNSRGRKIKLIRPLGGNKRYSFKVVYQVIYP